MTLGLFGLILLAAVFHAGWNFFAKRAGGNLTVLWLATVVGSAVTLPVALVAQRGSPVAWDGVAIGVASGVIHALYWWGIAAMYRHGDISLAYPVARGSGVLGTALGAVLWLHDSVSAAGAAGIVAVSLGVVAIGFNPRATRAGLRAVGLALLTGASIAAYSLVDDQGVERLNAPAYLFVETAVAAVVMGLARLPQLRGTIAHAWRVHRVPVWIVGIASPATYLIILFAYSLGPVGYVVAVREFSVVIAAILGASLLGERIGWMRRAGIALVVVGMALIKVA